MRPERGKPLEDVDGVGQLIIVFTQFGRGFCFGAVGFDLFDFVLGQAVIGQCAAQIGFGAISANGTFGFLLGFGVDLAGLGYNDVRRDAQRLD